MLDAILIIEKAVRKIAPDANWVEISIPPQESLGDISTNIAMSLAKHLKKPPVEIANEVVGIIGGEEVFEKVSVAHPGFINFIFSRDYLYKFLGDLIREKRVPVINRGAGVKTQVEFVSANPTGPLHLGHGRGAALGMAISNLLKKGGYEVEREYYINDAGRQVKLLGESVFARYMEILSREYRFPEDGYRGEYIRDIAMEIYRRIGDRYRDSDFNEVEEFFVRTSVDIMMDRIRDDLGAFGIVFDNFKSERDLYESGEVQKTLSVLESSGFIYERDGALWFNSERFGDDKDRVLKKSDGEYTYFTSDIAYHKDKIDRGFNYLINIWGADHHGYERRVRSALRALGYPDERLKILFVQMVNLMRGGKPVQMSKRAGEFVTLREVIDEVGADSAKFIFLTRRSDSHLDFDLEVVKLTSQENPVYYVQYAHARIMSIMRNAIEMGVDPYNLDDIDFSLLSLDEELRLIKKLVQYPLVFDSALRTLEPHRFTFYLMELAGLFHPYYNKYRFLTDDINLAKARLGLAEGIRIIIKECLDILGVSAPERM